MPQLFLQMWDPSAHAQHLEGGFPGHGSKHAALLSYKARWKQEMLRDLTCQILLKPDEQRQKEQ